MLRKMAGCVSNLFAPPRADPLPEASVVSARGSTVTNSFEVMSQALGLIPCELSAPSLSVVYYHNYSSETGTADWYMCNMYTTNKKVLTALTGQYAHITLNYLQYTNSSGAWNDWYNANFDIDVYAGFDINVENASKGGGISGSPIWFRLDSDGLKFWQTTWNNTNRFGTGSFIVTVYNQIPT